jgi:hypothetical protein
MKPYAALINASVQIFAIIGMTHFAISWAIYPLFLLVGLMIFAQTTAAGYAFSGKEMPKIEKTESESNVLGFMVSVIYALSAYHMYAIGFVFFSGLMAAHVAISFVTLMFKG